MSAAQYLQNAAQYLQIDTLDPKFAGAYYNRGLLYQERGERSAATTDFQKARDLYRTVQNIQSAKNRLKELGVNE